MAGSLIPRAEPNTPFPHYKQTGGGQFPVVYLHPDSAAGGGGGGTTVDREFRSTRYQAATASAGNYAVGDLISRTDMLDVTVAPPTILSTFWFNETQGTVPGAVTQGHLIVAQQMVQEAQGTTVNETTVSADNTNKALLAADATRRRIVVINPTAATTKLGLTTNSSATFAQCPIVLSPGDMWVESLAAASAWRCIMETGTATVPVQTVK